MKVLYMANVPSPYRVDFFNELGKEVDLTVTFEKATSDERDKSWLNYSFTNFNGIFLKGKSFNTDSAICLGITKIIKNGHFDKIVVSDFVSPTGMIAIKYMQNRKIPYIIESDGGFANKKHVLRNFIKKLLLKKADMFLSTGAEHDNYYKCYGATEDKIKRVPFSSVFDREVLPTPLNDEEKKAVRKKLGIKEEKVVLSVGQFIYRKGFDVLIRSAKLLPDTVALIIIGGKPTEEYKQLVKEQGIHNVYFCDFLSKNELAEYYKCADMFVFPTREDIWGLVINEALSKGLPIITTERCLAGVEMVKEGENGFIVPVDNFERLAKKILRLLLDRPLAEKMSEKNVEKAKLYTIETMVKSRLELFGK